MSMTLQLPDELAARLRAEAERRGATAETVAVQILAQHLPPTPAGDIGDLFAQWAAEDAATQEEAEEDAWFRQWMAAADAATPEDDAEAEEFFKALDADHPSYRKLYPDDLKGVTW